MFFLMYNLKTLTSEYVDSFNTLHSDEEQPKVLCSLCRYYDCDYGNYSHRSLFYEGRCHCPRQLCARESPCVLQGEKNESSLLCFIITNNHYMKQ